MKDYVQATDNTSLKEPFSPWAHTGSDLFKKAETDSEPLRNAPVPLAQHTSEILPWITPEPLLAITPEKSLAQARAEKTLRSHEECGGERRGRQRVRFAPDTRASPPSKASDSETERKMMVDCEESDRSNNASKSGLDEESLPRSFSAVSQKLYQPGRYTDCGDGRDSFPPSSSVSKSSVPKRQTVDSQPNQTAKASVDQSAKNITSTYWFSDHHPDKPLTTRIVRHKPTTESSGTDYLDSFSNGYAAAETLSRTPPRSRSASPSHCSRSPQPSRGMSPNRQGRSPASSSPSRHRASPCRGGSGRGTPVGGVELEARIMEEESQPEILVIREAPYHPKHRDYVFPFEEGEESAASGYYDPTVENPLARPEFNSALKIGQELKSVKGRQPDTWGAVSQKLKSCERKRTEIQEKASSRVNFQLQCGLYSDLVDVDVPLDDLCHTLEKDIRLRAPSPKAAGTVKVPVGKEPDLMEFFSPDPQQGLLDLTLTGIQPITESLTTANPMLAFDLYRHNRTWNGLADS